MWNVAGSGPGSGSGLKLLALGAAFAAQWGVINRKVGEMGKNKNNDK